MNVVDLKPHHERIVALYNELREKTPPGENIGWTSYIAEHPEVAEELGLNGSTDGVRLLRNYAHDYIIRKESADLRRPNTVSSKVKGYLTQMREHHDFIKRIYEENKGNYKRFQWNRLFTEHPEYLEQLGLPPLELKDDPSHTYASKVCSTYVHNYIDKKPLVLKGTTKKRVPPSRQPEYQRHYSQKWYAKKKLERELAAKTQAALSQTMPNRFTDVPTHAVVENKELPIHYCPNCGCELRQYRK